MNLVAVGSIAYDFIQTPQRPEGIKVLGGSATYFSVGASFLVKPHPVGVVGEDFAEEDLEFLRGLGVDTSGIVRKKGKTFYWHGRYHEDMEHRDSIVTQLNVFGEFEPELPDEFREAELLFLGNIAPRLQLKVLDQMKGNPFVAADTIDLWIETARPQLMEVISRTNLMFLNEEEIVKLTGITSLTKATRALLDLGPSAVVLKRGDAGAMLVGREGWSWMPAYPVEEVVDPTGAGDSFAGGLLGFLAKRGESSFDALKAALVLGTAVASLTVEGFGPRALAARGWNAVKERTRELLESIRIDESMILPLIGIP